MGRFRIGVAAAMVAMGMSIVPSALPRPNAEPTAYTMWRPSKQPRAGTQFTGVVVTLFQEAEITMRPDSFTFRCGRGKLTPKGKRKSVRYAPVRMVKFPDRGPVRNTGTPVIGVWVCTWAVPSGTAGWNLTSTIVVRSIGRDPATGTELGPNEEGGPLHWTVAR